MRRATLKSLRVFMGHHGDMNGIMPVRELQELDKKGESTVRDGLKQELGDFAMANPGHPDAKNVEFEDVPHALA